MKNNVFMLKEVNKEIIDQLVNIYSTSFKKFNSRIWNSQDFIELLNSGAEIFYYLSKNKIVGFIATNCNKEFFEIISIAIENRYQRKKIGSDLLYYIINKKDFPGKLIIDVSINNKGGIKFYENFGFKKIGERKNYYIIKNENGTVNKVDAHIMEFLAS